MCDLFNLRGRNLTNIAREGVLKGGPQMGYAKFSLAGYAKIFGKKSWRERVCIPHLSTQNRFEYSKFLPTNMTLSCCFGVEVQVV
jgi:hypothetical protein